MLCWGAHALRASCKATTATEGFSGPAALGLCTCRALSKELQPRHQTHPWPVIVVDQANELMRWQEHHPRDVHNLLSFLIQISKEAQQCHVVLATSECGFIDWLYQGTSGGRGGLPDAF